MEPFIGISTLEQYSNEQVGAAAKALMLTWLITADELREGEQLMRLSDGVLDYVKAQSLECDTELTIHAVEYAKGLSFTEHECDVAATPEQAAAVAASLELARVLGYVLRHCKAAGVSL